MGDEWNDAGAMNEAVAECRIFVALERVGVQKVR